ncbi:anti-sigma factor domain-containing protein [Occultella aeris]|uniref:Regulator of SigK n=1 Tax=Occultella aeris TaxID=2761496 RepID=A0A7M4DQZ5_9MICO|nr:anti-sigma factor [Occultella aeris]VZO39889.1 Anti-sigma-K factor rskA [Occultella aeris]
MTVAGESAHALTGAHVLDALDADEVEAFEVHLAACSDCREEVQTLRMAVLRLPAVSAVAPPPELRGTVLDLISQVRPLPPLPERTGSTDREPSLSVAPGRDVTADPAGLGPARARRDRRANRWRLVAAAAVVVALGSAGWGALGGDGPPVREIAGVQPEGETRLRALLDAPDLEVFAGGDNARVHGTVLRSAALDISAAILRNLPSLGADEVFQAWTLAGSAPASAGLFSSSDGGATVLLGGDVLTADAVAVTIEPQGGSPAPTGDILFEVDVARS